MYAETARVHAETARVFTQAQPPMEEDGASGAAAAVAKTRADDCRASVPRGDSDPRQSTPWPP